jgi:hypothetical protein
MRPRGPRGKGVRTRGVMEGGWDPARGGNGGAVPRRPLSCGPHLRDDSSVSRLRPVLFWLAAVGLAVSTTVHVASFFVVIPMRAVSILPVGAIGLGGLFVLTANARRPGFFGPRLRELLANAPPWGERALQLVFLNFVLQFGALILATRTSLTADRPAPPGYETRMLSAFWMTVYLLCVLAWWTPRPGVPPTR